MSEIRFELAQLMGVIQTYLQIYACCNDADDDTVKISRAARPSLSLERNLILRIGIDALFRQIWLELQMHWQCIATY